MIMILDEYLRKKHGQKFEEASVALIAFSGEPKSELLFPIEEGGTLYRAAIKEHGSNLLEVENTIREFCTKTNSDIDSVDKYFKKLRNSVLTLI